MTPDEFVRNRRKFAQCELRRKKKIRIVRTLRVAASNPFKQKAERPCLLGLWVLDLAAEGYKVLTWSALMPADIITVPTRPSISRSHMLTAHSKMILRSSRLRPEVET